MCGCYIPDFCLLRRITCFNLVIYFYILQAFLTIFQVHSPFKLDHIIFEYFLKTNIWRLSRIYFVLQILIYFQPCMLPNNLLSIFPEFAPFLIFSSKRISHKGTTKCTLSCVQTSQSLSANSALPEQKNLFGAVKTKRIVCGEQRWNLHAWQNGSILFHLNESLRCIFGCNILIGEFVTVWLALCGV